MFCHFLIYIYIYTHLNLFNHKTFHSLNSTDAGQFVQTHRLIFAIVYLTIYSIITFLTPMKYHIFENIMENGALLNFQ